MPKKNTATYTILVLSGIGAVLLVVVAFVLNAGTPTASPPQTFKIKASSTTYKKVVNLKMDSPTISPSVISSTPASTDFNIVITQAPTITASATATIAFTYQSTPVPSVSSTQELPQSGLFGVSIGAIILGFVAIFVAFLL